MGIRANPWVVGIIRSTSRAVGGKVMCCRERYCPVHSAVGQWAVGSRALLCFVPVLKLYYLCRKLVYCQLDMKFEFRLESK